MAKTSLRKVKQIKGEIGTGTVKGAKQITDNNLIIHIEV
jgi:hypothetical protein